MKKTEAVRLAELQTQRELIKALLLNPVVEIIAAYTIIEYLQKQGYIGNVAGSIAEGGCLASVAYQQMSPHIPQLLATAADVSQDMVGGISKLAPLAIAGL